MSMQPLVCPHCGKYLRQVPANEKMRGSVVTVSCNDKRNCGKRFSYYNDHGRIITMK